jgi:hypothetical protein
MSRTKGKNSKIRKLRDLYETPHWCIDLLADALHEIITPHVFTKPFYLCDIGAGDGRIGVACKRRLKPAIKTHCLLIDVHPTKRIPQGCSWLTKDFMKLNIAKVLRNKKLPRLFVSNPPFSLADQIVFKTIAHLNACHTGIAAFLLRVNWLGSIARSKWLQANPPKKLLVLTPRPSFTGKGTDATEYAWFLWGKNIELGNAINIVKKPLESNK